MSETITGTISFINHDKEYAMVEYTQGNKKKTIRASIDCKLQNALKEKKIIKKTHHFMTGDVVSFKPELSEKGHRMVAANLEFLYNNALDALLNKSKLSNRFLGYLKQVDDKLYVKEIESYLFFPVPLSAWQLFPDEEELNEQVTFTLENIDKKEKVYAALADNNYIPEFRQAVKLMKAKTPLLGEVYKVSPHGVYLNLIGDKIRGKLKFEENYKPGDKVNVMITYIGRDKIAIEKFPEYS